MWGTFLSEPLLIDGLVGRYPANYLIRRIPIPYRQILWSSFDVSRGQHTVLIRLSTGYPVVKGRLDTRYSPVRRSAATNTSPKTHVRGSRPRLACVKPVASVHPEPGSNSPLYNLIIS